MSRMLTSAVTLAAHQERHVQGKGMQCSFSRCTFTAPTKNDLIRHNRFEVSDVFWIQLAVTWLIAGRNIPKRTYFPVTTA